MEIGVGLESSNPMTRDLCVNKSYRPDMFEKLVKKVRKHCRLLAYVLIKPSFLTEKEGLDDSH